MKETIKINSVDVEITWLEDHGDAHCGWARILDDQAPPENISFELGKDTYHIGKWDGLFARVYLRRE